MDLDAMRIDFAKLMASRDRLESENIPHSKFQAATAQQRSQDRFNYIAECSEFIYLHGNTIAELLAIAAAPKLAGDA